ncbi:DUF192 domain-containing protein [Marinibacterium profundimaris]|uniref:DUF192 domain-containing protein n=1 Tax=Marinibacterium profundimaris TaxID=1679460 RepID=A0A225NQ58_9RHOB|nr:DUF192 domain-containing protein [Marinibacterium profundimaris]OWU74662.1 hypothetical protein ATO3_08525 [Marinibacterium profundimaris]
MRISVALAGILLAGVVGVQGALAACSPEVVGLRGDWGQLRFNVTVADDDPSRAQGLMDVEEMPNSTGMLFVFDPPRSVSFWMKNTLIPLDMIFTDETGTVVRVHSNAIPGDLTPIPGGDGIYTVLEINGGLADRYGIAEGSELQHPVYGEEAAWPCE